MFLALLNLRLVVLDSLNNLPEDERPATASAWIDILELEATRLADGAADWLPISTGLNTPLRRRHVKEWARMLGQVDARLSLIVADQIVASLLRGYGRELEV